MKKILFLFVTLILTSGCAETSDVQYNDDTVTDKANSYDDVPLKTITAAEKIDFEFYNSGGDGELVSLGHNLGHNKVLFKKGTQIFLYDIAENTADYIDEYDSFGYGSINSLYMNGRYYFYARSSRKSDSGNAIYIVDTKEKSTSVLADVPGNFPAFSQYSENELMYFYYYEQNGKYYQYVKLYNVETKEDTLLLENISDSENSPEIYAADVYGGELYVLFHEIAEQKLKTYINIYDRNGNLLKSIYDIDLGIQEKEKINDYYITAADLYVHGDDIFIKTRSMYGSFLFGFKYDGDRLSKFYGFDTGDKNLYSGSDFVRHARFDTAVKSGNFLYFKSDIKHEVIIFDLTTEKSVRFNFNIDGFYNLRDIVPDEKGSIVFSLFDDERKNVKYYYLSFEKIKALADE